MKKFKFKIGQYVCHRAGGIRPSKMLVVSRGQMEELDGSTQNLYLCAHSSAGNVYRVSYLYEHELQSAGEREPVSGVRSAWRNLVNDPPHGIIDEYHEYPIDPAKLDGPFLKVDEINPDHHGPASD